MDFKKFKHTKRKLTEVGFILKRGLQKELSAQKHNAKFAQKPNFGAIKKWVSVKGLPPSAAVPVFRKLQRNYGKPYVLWQEGNSLRRTNFAGYVANKFKAKIVNTLAPAIGKDVAKLIGDSFKTPKII